MRISARSKILHGRKIVTNISTRSEDIFLDSGRFIIIDALYLNELKEATKTLNSLDIDSLKEICNTVFPFMDFPFGHFKVLESQTISLNQIKKYDDSSNCSFTSIFQTDSGLLLLVDEKSILKYAQEFDYNLLVEGDPIDINYWIHFNTAQEGSAAVIISPGQSWNSQFEGSGIYYLYGDNLRFEEE